MIVYTIFPWGHPLASQHYKPGGRIVGGGWRRVERRGEKDGIGHDDIVLVGERHGSKDREDGEDGGGLNNMWF